MVNNALPILTTRRPDTENNDVYNQEPQGKEQSKDDIVKKTQKLGRTDRRQPSDLERTRTAQKSYKIWLTGLKSNQIEINSNTTIEQIRAIAQRTEGPNCFLTLGTSIPHPQCTVDELQIR